MNDLNQELWNKIRQQFDSDPYPNIPLEMSPKNDCQRLGLHSIEIAHYLRNRSVISPKNKLILDAGCGAGYDSLSLAVANPGAKIIGIDLSQESVEIAQKRLNFHEFNNVEFHVLPIDEVATLGYQFDYINCDEVLYLFPNIANTLKLFKSVLKPDGIIRANLHSMINRFNVFRAQEVFSMMGLMDENPEEFEISTVQETMKALKDNVNLKFLAWGADYEGAQSKQRILMNYLFQGDKGYKINDLFAALEASELSFIKMTNWREWDLLNLFKEPDNLPAFLGMALPDITIQEELQLFELLQPKHRLLDFLCGYPGLNQDLIAVNEWNDQDWLTTIIHLHPQARFDENLKFNLENCIGRGITFQKFKQLPLNQEFVTIESTMALCLWPLFDQPFTMNELVAYWQQRRPINGLTNETISTAEVFNLLKTLLTILEEFDCVMLEQSV
ncbi:MAG: class I SAM-dependent methyltransferase [Synechococcaceae cyanobacterium RL_1_2]|nr:class I SAM-dependent methyltransferase [Synechococcaceae cyanobacterium RL_1_2]